jgi:enhancer of mRNA-decapping protein 4
MLVCEAVNHEQLFSQLPCPLTQPILLSLIQQLCCDLTAHLELKQKCTVFVIWISVNQLISLFNFRYIESALLALDITHEVTSQHLPSVVETLILQLKGAIQNLQASEPMSPLLKQLRMLQMAAQSLLR